MGSILVTRNGRTTHASSGLQFLVPAARGRPLQAAGWLEFGLWDHAFRADGTLYDGPDEADHVCGADSRRFYLGLRDPSRTTETVEVAWKTTSHRGGVLDDNLGNPTITLARQRDGSYLSEGLLLVCDDQDRDIALWSARARGSVRRGAADHRVRRASMFGDVIAQLPARGAPTVEVRVPVFRRSPDARRRFNVELFVIDYSNVPYGVRVCATTERVFRDLQAARDTFERIGVWVQPSLPRFDPTSTEPRHRPKGRVVPLPDGGAYTFIPFPPGASPGDWRDTDSDNLALSLPPLPPHTMRAVYVRALGHDAGNSVPDNLNRSGAGHLFVGVPGKEYTLAHEAGHILLDLRDDDSHYVDPMPPPHSRHRRFNLMSREGDQDPSPFARKRIWDATLFRYGLPQSRMGCVSLNVNQYQRMRASPYLR